MAAINPLIIEYEGGNEFHGIKSIKIFVITNTLISIQISMLTTPLFYQ
jgi:hypothetical protein